MNDKGCSSILARLGRCFFWFSLVCLSFDPWGAFRSYCARVYDFISCACAMLGDPLSSFYLCFSVHTRSTLSLWTHPHTLYKHARPFFFGYTRPLRHERLRHDNFIEKAVGQHPLRKDRQVCGHREEICAGVPRSGVAGRQGLVDFAGDRLRAARPPHAPLEDAEVFAGVQLLVVLGGCRRVADLCMYWYVACRCWMRTKTLPDHSPYVVCWSSIQI